MHGARPAYQARDDSLHALPQDLSGAALMAAEFVTLTDYYTDQPLAVRVERVVTAAQIGTSVHLEVVGAEGDIVVREPFAVVVASLNGEDQTDGR